MIGLVPAIVVGNGVLCREREVRFWLGSALRVVRITGAMGCGGRPSLITLVEMLGIKKGGGGWIVEEEEKEKEEKRMSQRR